MNLMDRMGNVRGEFRLIGKDKDGNIIYDYFDNNVVVNDARPTTAYALSRSCTEGASRPEKDGDGIDRGSYLDDLINMNSFQISYMKFGGGFPRKRSFCGSLGQEKALIPSEIKASTDIRSSLYVDIALGSTITDTIPTDWAEYGSILTQQPFHTSSLLYPRKTDIDLVDRDYQFAKRILNYDYSSTPTTAGFRANFTTTMRFWEGNGPDFDCEGVGLAENRYYEYREAGLYVGAMPWQFSDSPASENDVASELTAAMHPKSLAGSFLASSQIVGVWDETLSGNTREYRFWDGQSSLVAGYGSGGLDQWPNAIDASYIWTDVIDKRNNFSSINGTDINNKLRGELFDGFFMVARKTFPTITKTKDLEFTITWSLVFG